MYSPEPLSAKKLLKIMPTDGSIVEIYKRLSPQKKVESSISTWGDAIVWSEFHRTTPYPELWS
jgi:transposase